MHKTVDTNKTPDQLVFNLPRMANGTYPVKGKMSQEWWQALCQELGFPVPTNPEAGPEEGSGTVDLTLELSLPRFRIYGTLDMTLTRQCVRSLEFFEHKTTTYIDEFLTLSPTDDAPQNDFENDSGQEIYHGHDVLDMGEYLRQQFILAVDPYPIAGDGIRGGVVLSDGLDETLEDDEENPFAILKNMGS